MDSSTDDYPQGLESHGSAPFFVVFGIASLCIPWFMLMCFAFFCRRQMREDQPEDDGDRSTLHQTITEVERRKTLMHCFQRNQVTMVRICAWHFHIECRPVY
jgi:hypothetical protein